MATSKKPKTAAKKSQVQLRDLKPRKDAKGGLKYEDVNIKAKSKWEPSEYDAFTIKGTG